jgi:hypothetical protein
MLSSTSMLFSFQAMDQRSDWRRILDALPWLIVATLLQSPNWFGFHDMSLQSFRLRLLKFALEYWRDPFLQSVPAFIMSSNSW